MGNKSEQQIMQEMGNLMKNKNKFDEDPQEEAQIFI